MQASKFLAEALPGGEDHAHASAAGRVLLAGAEQWWVRSIRSIFEPFGYEVHAAGSGVRAVQHLRATEPEAAIIHCRLEDGSGLELIHLLRARGFGPERPIILVSEEPLRRDERLEALRAGAWDCLSAPLAGDELVLKMESYLGATRVATRAREQALVDEASGLYNLHGVLRWARELGHSARRYRRPFGCAVFAPAEPSAAPEGSFDDDHLPRAIGDRLTDRGRTSDIIGRLTPSEFVVIAADTGPEGIRTMASRFVDSGQSADGAIPLRSGCYAVADLSAGEVEPEDVLARATLALRQSGGTGEGAVSFFQTQSEN